MSDIIEEMGGYLGDGSEFSEFYEPTPPEPSTDGVKSKSVHFMSKTDNWSTPQEFYDKLHEEFIFTLDPCADKDNAKCKRYFTKEDDGLTQDWSRHTVFMNPPYGRAIRHWIKKAYDESFNGSTVVCLVPARTDTSYWHDYVIGGKAEVRFIRGRLKFGNSKNSAPFPSAIVIFRSKV